MGTEMIIRDERRNFHHLSDVRIAEIVTKVDCLRKSGMPRTAGMKRIAEETGCALDTVYRIYRQSYVEFKDTGRDCRYVTVRIEHSSDAVIRMRIASRLNSLANRAKHEKCDEFIRLCVDYIKGSRIRTIDEAVHVIGKDYAGPKICTKTLYNYVNQGKIEALRRIDLPRAPGWKTKKKYKKYTAQDSRGTSILERPEAINSREEFGHWEGDLVVGPRDGANGAYLTLIERTTRFYLMIPVKNKRSLTILKALRRQKRKTKGFGRMFKSITFDNGVEFAMWREMEKELGIKTYFGRPYHSCDRGSNENCNGLVRRYIRKGTDINTVSRKTTRMINTEINEKRRRLLGYESAATCFFNMLKKQGIEYSTIYP